VCLIVFSLGHHPGYPLVIAANRDESYDRPAESIAFWGGAPHIAGGRDLRAGGTWLGITRQGRWAALTNFRRAKSWRDDAPSRGHLVSDFLMGDLSPMAYLESLLPRAHAFNGFNLLVGDRTGVWYFSNRDGELRHVEPGIHGLSNHLLDTPWPKVVMAKQALREVKSQPVPAMTEALAAAMSVREVPPGSALPDTGIGLTEERLLSPPFIAAGHYGTRMTTVLLVDAEGRVSMEERTFGPYGAVMHTTRLAFRFDDAAEDLHQPATTIATESGR